VIQISQNNKFDIYVYTHGSMHGHTAAHATARDGCSVQWVRQTIAAVANTLCMRNHRYRRTDNKQKCSEVWSCFCNYSRQIIFMTKTETLFHQPMGCSNLMALLNTYSFILLSSCHDGDCSEKYCYSRAAPFQRGIAVNNLCSRVYSKEAPFQRGSASNNLGSRVSSQCHQQNRAAQLLQSAFKQPQAPTVQAQCT